MNIFEIIVGYMVLPVTCIAFFISLVFLVDEDVHNFGISDRIADALYSIHKKKGINK